MCDLDHFGVRCIEDIHIVDADDDVPNFEAWCLCRSIRFDGRDDNWAGAMYSEPELPRLPLHHHGLVTFWNIMLKWQSWNLHASIPGTHQVLAYVDDVNLTADHIRTIERNADVLLNACKDIGSAVNTGETKYMEIEHHRGMIANEYIRIGSNI